MQLLEYLISTYEENEGLTADEILAEAIKQDPRYSRLNREESIELKRRFLDYVRDSEERSAYEERKEKGYANAEDIRFDKLSEEFSSDDLLTRKRGRAHKKYVEAFINNISVPNTLEEMQELFMDGNDAQELVAEATSTGMTCWTVPKWAKRGDIVLFMHAKTANSTLTKLRTEVRNKYDPDSDSAKRYEQSIAEQLAFHKQYGGKIYAFGRVNGIPKKYEISPLMHAKSSIFCDIDRLVLLDEPVDISEINGFITISRQSGVTPVFGSAYERLKEIICEKNLVPDYFKYSYSTPYPHSIVNRENWMKLGVEYRHAFTLEIQFRQCYVDYLLSELGDQKTVYRECTCYKGTNPLTFVDNVIRIDKKLLPVEVKLNIKAVGNLEGQCEQYCKLDNLVLSKRAKRSVNMKDVIDDRVLVIDTFGVYTFYLNDKSIRTIYDLDDIRSSEDLMKLRKEVLNSLCN